MWGRFMPKGIPKNGFRKQKERTFESEEERRKYEKKRQYGRTRRANKAAGLPPQKPGPKPDLEARARKAEYEAAVRAQKELNQQAKVLARVIKIKEARDDLLKFTELSMPHPEDPGDATRSLYDTAPHHVAICEALQKVERGDTKRLIITMPPRHGKSELASRRFPAWFVGRDPNRQVIFTAYGQEFAEEFGREWRDIIRAPAYRQVFPDTHLRKDSAATGRMQLCYQNVPTSGILVAVGVGGTITGRGADLFLIDDPIKNDEEASSPLQRDKLWNWYTKTAYHRLMPGGRIVIIMTRWHEDDLVGRLTDPSNPFYDAEEAATWTVLKLPAELNGAALWPDRYPMSSLQSIKRTLRARAYSALYLQEPTPEEGAYFSHEMLVPYRNPEELPKDLRIFAASDHALTTKEENDATVMGCFGVDANDHLWLFPDLVWDRIETDEMLEQMMMLMKRHKPDLWFAEDEHINKALGPFRRKRMQEEKVYTGIHGIRPTRDLRARARSIQGRMSMGMVHFPVFAEWWPKAVTEITRFDRAPHDDFVAFLALVGMGMDAEHAATAPKAPQHDLPQTGSMAWLKQSADYQERRSRLKVVAGGF